MSLKIEGLWVFVCLADLFLLEEINGYGICHLERLLTFFYFPLLQFPYDSESECIIVVFDAMKPGTTSILSRPTLGAYLVVVSGIMKEGKRMGRNL